MSMIFEETGINGMRLRNRLVRSATWEGMCDAAGRPTPKLRNCYQALATGGVGLIISGYTFVRPEGKQLPGKMGMHTDDFADDYRAMTRAVHLAGGKIAVQLVHAGGQTDAATAGRRPLAPSALKLAQYPEVPAELSVADIRAIVEAFGEGARRAREWGFDGVQLHGAHGYLINQFLSPLTNQRTDAYGGGIENRCSFLMEVYRRVRKSVGPDFPVLIKLNGADNLAGGLTLDDSLVAAGKLSAAGIDAIEVSAGTPASGGQSPVRPDIDAADKEAYNLTLATAVKEAVRCPVMVVGGFRSFAVADRAVREAGMDYIAMARPLIREPNLPNRWRDGDHRSATCISCNGCFLPGIKEGGIYCVQDKKKKGK